MRLCSRKTLGLAIDQEQDPCDQRADPGDDAPNNAAKPYTQKTKAGDDQKDPEQNPFQLTSIHFVLLCF